LGVGDDPALARLQAISLQSPDLLDQLIDADE
jgi:hypothetical protein